MTCVKFQRYAVLVTITDYAIPRKVLNVMRCQGMRRYLARPAKWTFVLETVEVFVLEMSSRFLSLHKLDVTDGAHGPLPVPPDVRVDQ